MTLNLPFSVCLVINRLASHGFSVWLVGGCIRALLLGTQPYDIDLATDARPDEVLALFEGHKVNVAGLKHGTVMVIIDHKPIEITSLRIDGSYSDRRRPDQVLFTDSIEADLARRDFTINAMAWLVSPSCLKPIEPAKGGVQADLQLDQLIDPYQGQADLEAGLVRCVGAAEARFAQDALRILRALRLVATLGFAIEPQTAAAMRQFAADLQYIAKERILSELVRIINGSCIADVLLGYWDIMAAIFPECRSLQQQPDDLQRVAGRVSRVPADFSLRLAALLAPPCSQPVQPVLDRLRCDKATRHRVVQIIACAGDLPAAREQQVLQWLRRYSPSIGHAAIQLVQADAEASPAGRQNAADQANELEKMIRRLLDNGRCYQLKDLAVNGSDLRKLGVPPGRGMGRLLGHLLDLVIAGQVDNTRPALLQIAAAAIDAEPDRTE